MKADPRVEAWLYRLYLMGRSAIVDMRPEEAMELHEVFSALAKEREEAAAKPSKKRSGK
jgi:hypothetical protein